MIFLVVLTVGFVLEIGSGVLYFTFGQRIYPRFGGWLKPNKVDFCEKYGKNKIKDMKIIFSLFKILAIELPSLRISPLLAPPAVNPS